MHISEHCYNTPTHTCEHPIFDYNGRLAQSFASFMPNLISYILLFYYPTDQTNEEQPFYCNIAVNAENVWRSGEKKLHLMLHLNFNSLTYCIALY